MPIVFEVWGDYACFTRPETKVERFSYPIMTPSAARGVLDAIYVKPVEFSWRVERIEVLAPIQFATLRKNEVKEKLSETMLLSASRRGGEVEPIVCDANEEAAGRTQRQIIALKNVRYRVHATIKPREAFERSQKAFEEQAIRRISKGKCFFQPYLGCREFVAYFSLADNFKSTIEDSLDIGWMLYDVFNLNELIIDTAKPFISVFKARIQKGVLDIPPWESNLVVKPNDRGGYYAK